MASNLQPYAAQETACKTKIDPLVPIEANAQTRHSFAADLPLKQSYIPTMLPP